MQSLIQNKQRNPKYNVQWLLSCYFIVECECRCCCRMLCIMGRKHWWTRKCFKVGQNVFTLNAPLAEVFTAEIPIVWLLWLKFEFCCKHWVKQWFSQTTCWTRSSQKIGTLPRNTQAHCTLSSRLHVKCASTWEKGSRSRRVSLTVSLLKGNPYLGQ